jgi:O-antigen biosynthesis protein WbqP
MKFFIKYTFDFFFSLVLVLFLLPVVFFPIALLIRVTSKGPIFFTQKRIGVNKKIFYLIKFRTMKVTTPAEVPTHLLNNPNNWITPLGKFLRKTSLDELPQLFNVLKGEMSIVGPRPALWNQDDLIQERDKYCVNSLRPGLTGWSQINGRDTLSIKLKAKMDGEYLHKQSFWFDIYVILKTIFKIFNDSSNVEGGTGSQHSDL